MKERPILFKPEMVSAILKGEKTQTRRVVKGKYQGRPIADALPDPWLLRMCPYGVVGDVLWVRETWSCAEKKFEAGAPVVHKGSLPGWPEVEPLGGRWRPSIHMPKAACRLRLEITEIRIELLYDISEADARAEGVVKDPLCPHTSDAYRTEFFNLWEQINGTESLQSNPWVWVVTFKEIES